MVTSALPRRLEQAMVDASGRATFTGMPAGKYDVHAWSPTIDLGRADHKVTLGDGETQEVVFTSTRPISIQGVLTLEDGSALPGELLCLSLHPFRKPVSRIATQGDGSFRFTSPVAEGASFLMWFERPEYVLVAPNPGPWYVAPAATSVPHSHS
jgi:hypothetical protein